MSVSNDNRKESGSMAISMPQSAGRYLSVAPHLHFTIACFGISLTAFVLLMMRAPHVVDEYLQILFSYGLSVISIMIILLLGHFATAIFLKMKKGTAPSDAEKLDWYKAYFRDAPWLNILSATGALIITMTSFTVHKGVAIGADGYHFDETFIAWDRMIFGGTDPWVITHHYLSSPIVTQIIDFLYHPAFLPMMIGYLICIIARGKPALRQTYMIAYLVSFTLIGMVAAVALNSAGPVFDGVLFGDGTTFGPLMDRLQEQVAAGSGPQTSDLIRRYLTYLHLSDQVNMGAGISAMPSMHIALAVLWIIPAFHINRILGVFMTLYGMLIWAASVHLGWHYFVDGLVALVMVAVIWVIVGYIMGLYGRPQVIRATT